MAHSSISSKSCCYCSLCLGFWLCPCWWHVLCAMQPSNQRSKRCWWLYSWRTNLPHKSSPGGLFCFRLFSSPFLPSAIFIRGLRESKYDAVMSGYCVLTLIHRAFEEESPTQAALVARLVEGMSCSESVLSVTQLRITPLEITFLLWFFSPYFTDMNTWARDRRLWAAVIRCRCELTRIKPRGILRSRPAQADSKLDDFVTPEGVLPSVITAWRLFHGRFRAIFF